ncbi:MAG: 50S ribosomal protein L25 [Sphaerochaetaceae bacterium]
MNEVNLTGVLRKEDFGSAGARRVIKEGRIPAVIYGKEEPVHVTLDAVEFRNILRRVSESTLLTLKIGRKKKLVLMKDLQENILLDRINHVDFFEVTTDEVLRANVPIILEGHPEGAKFGGVLEQVAYEIEVECLPLDLPQHVAVDVSGLGLNEVIMISDLKLPAGVKAVTHGDHTVASVKSVKEEVEEEVSEEEDVEVEGEKAERTEEKSASHEE